VTIGGQALDHGCQLNSGQKYKEIFRCKSDHLAGIVVISLAPSLRKTSDTVLDDVIAGHDSMYVSHQTCDFLSATEDCGLQIKKGNVIESLRLEETSKIMKSNHQPNTTMTTKPCPKVPRLHVFLKTSGDGDFTTSLGSLFQCLTTLSVKKFFLISNLNLP